MDQTNCSQGYATDHLFLYGDDFVPYQCDVSHAFYVAFFAILCIVRGGIVALQFRIWWYRLNKEKERKTQKRNRLPVAPTLSFLSFVALVVFTILSSTNAANASNGVPGFLLAVIYTPMMIGFQFHFDRVIRLGKRLLPLSRVTEHDKQNADLTQHLASLSESTRLLQLIRYAIPFAALVAVVGFLAGLIRPVFVTYQIGTAAYAIPDLVFPVGICAQYQRLILVTRECKKLAPDQVGPKTNSLDHAIMRFKMYQAFYISVGPIMAMTWLLTTCRIVPARYWFAMIYIGAEAATMGYMTMINVPREWLSFSGMARPTTSDDNGQAIVIPAAGSVTEITSGHWQTGNDNGDDVGSSGISMKADRTTSG